MRKFIPFSHLEEHKEILRDVLILAEEAVRKRGRRLSHLRFAKRTHNGYAFFKRKRISWDILDEIAQSTCRLHPQYTLGKITDLISEMVNFAEKDLLSLRTSLA